jgi:hypothetical protein
MDASLFFAIVLTQLYTVGTDLERVTAMTPIGPIVSVLAVIVAMDRSLPPPAGAKTE